ncbi:hypothetical protein JCM8202_002593 [Rhodotorula sphaerocarpa]
MAEQVEKSFQKQPLFHNNKVSTTSRKVPGKDRRWYKEVGLGFKTPREAIDGTYIDKKCPFTGLVSIRGRILTGKVVSTKMNRTIIIRREYLHFVPKYSRYLLCISSPSLARPRGRRIHDRDHLFCLLRRRAVATVAAPPGTLLPCLRPATTPTDEKRHKNVAVHCSPAFRVEVGDQVTVGQCRPLSKTVRFNVLRVSKSKAKTFTRF